MKESEYVFYTAPSEIDNHADSYVLRRHFRVYFTTSKICTVSHFLPKYSKQVYVSIFTGANTVDLENGSTVVLIFGQGFWFGYIMDKSLVDQNQCRQYGIQFCSGPTYNYHELGLAIDENLFIPMGMEGTTCGSDSCCSTLEEMASCKRITVSHKLTGIHQRYTSIYHQWRRRIGTCFMLYRNLKDFVILPFVI